ncbi:hypothetical protein EV182_007741, partial [Spiromyces aspiralis]
MDVIERSLGSGKITITEDGKEVIVNYLQLEGLKFNVTMDSESGKYEVDTVMISSKDSDTVWEVLDEAKTYNIAIPDFLYNGGDGIFKFPAAQDGSGEAAKPKFVTCSPHLDLVIQYISTNSPLSPKNYVNTRITT